MSLNFPSSPTNGQTYTFNGVTWEYVSAKTKWVKSGAVSPLPVSAGGTGASNAAAARTALDAAQAFPSGTKLVFQQTNAPTGWTKDTTHDNKAMRIVSGTVGSGGSVNFTTAFASRAITGTASGTVGNTTLSTTEMPAHTHNTTTSNNVVGSGTTSRGPGTAATPSSSAGGGGAHGHSWSGSISVNNLDMAVQYVDFIIASKD